MTFKPRQGPDGVLLVDKPEGVSSFDVVKQVKKLVRPAKVGHTGTLDPMATGLLPLTIGEATKLAGHLTEGRKRYLARVSLGVATDTLDATGEQLETALVPPLSDQMLEKALDSFRGTIEQVPPMHSAVHHKGKRLYQLARQGIEVERSSRRVEIQRLVLVDRGPDWLQLDVSCSAGTYVRTLASDLAHAIETVGHLSELRRTEAAGWTIAQASELKSLDRSTIAQSLLDLEAVLERFEKIEMPGEALARLAQGRRLSLAELEDLGTQLTDSERLAWFSDGSNGPIILARIKPKDSDPVMDIVRVLRPPPPGTPKKH